jgi:hexosaminidase
VTGRYCLLPLISLAAGAAAAAPPPLRPQPSEIHEQPGTMAFDSTTPLVVPASDKGARNAAERLAELIHGARGFRPAIIAADRPGAIRFVRAPGLPAEAYRLDIAPDGATIRATDDAGLLYGAVTLWQLATQPGATSLPALSIEDAPRFGWRGLMLDSARHFQSPAYVRSLIDWMAVNKLNRLHWHLVDDQGWRIEIRKYPKLTATSAWRTPAGAPGAPPLPKTGGFYTQRDIRAIVAYAAAREIEIVPEIEMPGHAASAIRAYPKLGMGVPLPDRVWSEWGIFPWLYNVDEPTFRFLEDVLDEVMALFPSRFVHIGGDEAVKDQWKASPAIQAKISALGLKDETALQGWFMARLGRYLDAHGRRMIGWDEILEGGVPGDAVVMSWRGIDGAIAAAQAGHDTVLSPAPDLYLDHRQGGGPDEPPGRGAIESLRRVYAFDPAPARLTDAQQHHVLGLQGNMWTEHIRTEARAAWMSFPRAIAIAEIGWSGHRQAANSDRDYRDFLTRLVPQLDRMKPLGLVAADSAFAVRLGARGGRLRLDNQSELPIRYTLDGSAPTAAAPLYRGPIGYDRPVRLRGAAFLGDRALPGALDRTIDATTFRVRTSQQLGACNDAGVALDLEDDYPATGPRPHFLVNILQPCWIWRGAPLDGIATIAVSVGQLPFNFQLGKDRDAIRFRPPATPAGEVEIRAGCDGPPLATLPLAPAAANPGITRLVAPIAAAGATDLCITYTATGPDPLWAIDKVELLAE